MNKVNLNNLNSMLKVDCRRMFKTPLVYIMFGICIMMPILVLVMTSFMGNTSVVDPSTGEETVMETFTNAWQIFGATSNTGMAMDLTSMCNINLIYFIVAIFVCIFVSEDFRSGYAKNIFTIRTKRMDYVISKIIISFIASIIMLLLFFIGGLLGGSISNLPFNMDGFNVGTLICCLISKIFILLIFISIALTLACVAKTKLWLSIICVLGCGMLLFMMIPMMTPLDAGILNVIMCFAGGLLFSIGLAFVSKLILNKTNIV